MADTPDIVCASCGAQIQELARFCPECGAAAPGMGGAGTGDGEIAALLAAAARALKNRDYQTAKDKCSEAMSREPQHRSAQTLMGDIYFEQRLFSEAASWYQLAHEEDSGNQDLLRKLERARSLTRSAGAAGVNGNAPAASRTRLLAAQARLEEVVRSHSFQKYTAYLTIILAALALITILTAAYVRKSDRDNTALRPTYPVSGTAEPGSSGQPPQPNGPPYQVGQQTPRAQAGSGKGVEAATRTGALPQESALLNRLKTQVVSESGAEIQALWADMRDLSLTLVIGAKRGSGRKAVLLQAKDAANAAFALEQQAQRAVVRVNEELADYTGGASLQIAFTADITRDKASTPVAPEATADEIEKLFSRVYWHPTLRPAPRSAAPQSPTAP